jgi:histidinol-phosphatase
MNADWRNRYDAALDAARQAGQFALGYFDRGIAVEWKPDQSPVTMADRGAEDLLRKALLGKFPSDGFLGEEFGDTSGSSGFRWIIDPIDGTRSFVRGIPLWATLIGLEYRGELIAGVVFLPALKQTFHALRGHGAFRDERRIHVSDVGTLDKSHVYYSSISWFTKAGHERQFLELVKLTERQRGFGDFYGFMMVAQGSGEIMVEHGVHAWDIAAIVPIIEEAGGKLTAWDGKLDIEKPDVLGTNGILHERALQIISARMNVQQ